MIARVLTLIGLLPILAGAWLAVSQGLLIRRAEPTNARVLTAEKRFSSDSKGRRTESAVIRYRYEWNGESRESMSLTPSPLHIAPNADRMLQAYPEGTDVTAWVDPRNPARAFLFKHHSFVPYLFVVLGAPILALAAGLATGGVRHAKSGESEHPHPERQGDGWWEVTVFRPYHAMGRAAIAGAAVISAVALPPLAHYLSVAVPLHPGAAVLSIATVALIIRLSWAAFSRGWVGGRLEEARLFVRPDAPRPGISFAVRVTQSPKLPMTIAGFDVTIECTRRETKLVNRKTRTTNTRVVFERARIGESRHVGLGEPYSAEHVFALPSGAAGDGNGFLAWRLHVRTRIAGPDYRTHFPFPVR